MKIRFNLLGVALAFAIAVPAHSDEALSKANRELCESVYDVAVNTMIMRTLDFTKKDMYDNVDTYVDNESYAVEIKKIIDSAFEAPLNGQEDSKVVSEAFGVMQKTKCIADRSGLKA